MEEILKDLGLGDLIDTFKANEITPNVVIMLTDSEFGELGLETIGDRVRLRERCRDALKDSSEESPVVKRLKTMLKDRNLKGQRALFNNNRKEKETRRVVVGWKHATNQQKDVFKLMPPNKGGGKQELDIPKSLSITEVTDIFAKTYFPQGINIASGHHLKDLKYFVATFTGQCVETLVSASLNSFGDLVKSIGTSPLRLYLHTTEKELYQSTASIASFDQSETSPATSGPTSTASVQAEMQPLSATSGPTSTASVQAEMQPLSATSGTTSTASVQTEIQPSSATSSTTSTTFVQAELQPLPATSGATSTSTLQPVPFSPVHVQTVNMTSESDFSSANHPSPNSEEDECGFLQDILDLSPSFSLEDEDLTVDFTDAGTPTVSFRNNRPTQNRLRLRRTHTEPKSIQTSVRDDGPSDLSMKGILKWWIQKTKLCSEPQHILVNRTQVLKSTLRVITRDDYHLCKDFNVTFSGEDGDDMGGPKREFFRLLMADVASNITNGSFFVHDVAKLNTNQYEMAGMLVAFSILHGGPGLPIFHPFLYKYMTDQELHDYPSVQECVMDPEFRGKLEKVEQAHTEELYKSALAGISDLCCEKGLSIFPYQSLENKQQLLQALLKNETIYSVHTEIDQFRRGLNKVDRLFDAIMLAPAEFKSLLSRQDQQPLTFRQIREMYKVQFSEEGSNLRRLENQALYCLEAFLADCEGGATGISLAEVLAFWTGATEVPPLGFPKALEVSFGMNEQFPTAHTCNMELNIWRGYADPDVFQDHMNKAITWSGGFHLA